MIQIEHDWDEAVRQAPTAAKRVLIAMREFVDALPIHPTPDEYQAAAPQAAKLHGLIRTLRQEATAVGPTIPDDDALPAMLGHWARAVDAYLIRCHVR